MKKVRMGLMGLSIIQFIFEMDFWMTAYYWFFIWLITFNIAWFYLDSVKQVKMNLVLLSLLAIINIYYLPQLPYLMICLLFIEAKINLNTKEFLVFVLSHFIVFISLFSVTDNWPSFNEITIFLAFLFLSQMLINQLLISKEAERIWYQQRKAQDESEEKANLLKSQILSMEEIYTLNERNRISRDLHDSVGHTLSTLIIQLAAISKLTQDNNPKASQMLNQLQSFTKEGLDNVRKVIHKMKPNNYSHVAFIQSLTSLISEFEAYSQIMVYFNHNDMQWRLNEAQEMLIYRAIQEFLSNSAKHSQATEIRIQYHSTAQSLILTMFDNGKGTNQIKPQLGLIGMQERAKLLGASIQIQSESGKGFKIRLVIAKEGMQDGERKY